MDGVEERAPKPEEMVSLRHFLEDVHANVEKPVQNFWELTKQNGYQRRRIILPELSLHCRTCRGERNFRNPTGHQDMMWLDGASNASLTFTCGNCNEDKKQYYLRFLFDDLPGAGKLLKYGEHPPFGAPVPNKLLRLFGNADAELFMKGRQCETQGFGIAAFAYYRRVVENHRTDLLHEIIKVCQTVGASQDLIDELEEAKSEISFSKSIEKVKTALPDGLLIDGHNPLSALHSALSVSIHNESDQDCLQYAHAVRLVLGDLVERIAMLKQDNKQLSDAVQRLLAKRAK